MGQPAKPRDILWLVLILIQHSLYLVSRIMDDLSWQSVSIDGYQNELISLVAIILCIILKIGRKYCYEIDDFKNTIKLYLFTSQVRFLIPWALTILNCYLFYNIFGCYDVLPESGFYIQLKTCVLTMLQICMTNLNYSFATNTKTQLSELAFYELALFGEIIYNGSLLVGFVSSLQGKAKDLSILFLSMTIANQMLIMDLMFRGAYEQRVQQQQLKVTIKQYISLNNRQNAYAVSDVTE